MTTFPKLSDAQWKARIDYLATTLKGKNITAEPWKTLQDEFVARKAEHPSLFPSFF